LGQANHNINLPDKLLNDQLQEQIQKLIKDGKRHFSKDRNEQELHKYLKQVLTQYLDGPGNAGQPANPNAF